MLNGIKIKDLGSSYQYAISISLVAVTTVICLFIVELVGYRAVALILLLVVSLNAILFDIYPVLLSAILSASIWNFLFIPPTFTFRINNTEDALMFLMYFVIALINAMLTFKIKEFQHKVKEKEDKENSIKLYNTILNSLSHEFRTPISAIIGAIDTIKDNESTLTERHKFELYSEIETASLRLNRQVENLLSTGRLEAGMLKGNPDWCDVNELIYNVIQREKESLNSNLHTHTIVFHENEQLPLFKLDSGILDQVLHNILDNALRHTPNGSSVEIEVVDSEHTCQIVISDDGGGFPEMKIDRVFDKFYRLNTASQGGIGLGLFIVKGFIETQGGSIELSNNDKGGATFVIRIPATTTYINNLRNE